MILKNILLSILAVGLCTTLITGCGAPEEMKQEAENIKNENQPKFEQLVKDIYGKDAKLLDVSCGVNMSIGSPVPELAYSLPKTMEGRIQLADKSGRAIYNIDNGDMYDTLNTSNILESFLDQLPYDRDKILTIKFLDGSSELPKFKSGLTTYDDVMNTPNSMYGSYPRLYMTTLEDLSVYENTKINDIDIHTKMYKSSYPFNYVLCGVTKESQAVLLDKDFDKIQFNYINEKPYYEVHSDDEPEEDVIKKFGITGYITYNYFHPQDSYQFINVQNFEN